MVLEGYLYSLLYGLICLAIAFILYKMGVDKKITRKLVHILVGFEWVILYHFMGPGWNFLYVCLAFLLLLVVSHRKNLMPMISSDGENSPGTVYYAVAMSIMALICIFVPDMMLSFGIGVFCTSLGDGFAGLVGQSITASWNKKVYGNKTAVGAIVNFAACLGTSMFFTSNFDLGLNVWHCVAISTLALELELFTGVGLDNIAITLGTSFLSFAFVNYSSTVSYLLPILLTPALIAFAYNKRALTLTGIVAAIAVDLMISISLGNFGFTILFAFFAGGIVVDKIKKRYKKTRLNEKESLEKRGDCRDHVQVLANSLVATACSSLFLLTSNKVFLVAFVASLAEAFADTVASGIGVLSGKAFDLFRMKPCTPGLSGGISLLGTLFSLVASLVISCLALAFGELTIIDGLIVILSAFLGALFDSFLGSLLQVKYKCRKCGEIVEKEDHCGEKTERFSGISFINNDTVNFLGTLSAAIIATVIYIIM